MLKLSDGLREPPWSPCSSGLCAVVPGLAELAMLPRWKLGEFWSKIWALLLVVVGKDANLMPPWLLLLFALPLSRPAEK